jgi:hypothetical protein
MYHNQEIQQEFAKNLGKPVVVVCAKFEADMM